MWQFSQAIDGLGEACAALGTPITGGNVSFYNETLGKSIYPTPVIGILGILDDASKVLKIAFRNEGDIIVLLNGANSSGAGQHTTAPSARRREFSSSEYSKTIAGIVAGEPPSIELGAEKWLIDCLVALASANTIESAHDLSDGGAAVTIAESCFASSANQPPNCHPERSLRSEGSAFSSLGATVTLPENASAEYALFGESGARAIVSVSPTKLAALRATARQYGVGAHEIGKVTRDNSLRIEYKGHVVVQSDVLPLQDVWANSLQRTLKVQ